jgi:hypothetical protein
VAVNTIQDITEWLAGCQYIRDIELFHESDYWQHPTTFEQLRRGDCEDHALWAWRKLVELGLTAHLYVGQCDPIKDESRHHAWVVFEDQGTSYLLEPVNKPPSTQVRLLEEVRSEYRPHYAVDPAFRVHVLEGLLLYWRDQEMARRAKRKGAQQAA